MSQYAIVNGPSKWDLMLALFTESSPNQQLSIMIDIIFDGKSKRLGFRVNLVQREDGSGESWNIQGIVTSWESDDKLQELFKKSRNVKLYFRTDRRKGQLILG